MATTDSDTRSLPEASAPASAAAVESEPQITGEPADGPGLELGATPPAKPAAPERLVALDAFRGFMMILMVSDGLGLSDVAERFPDSQAWQFLDYQSSHVQWIGCALWDLIQPSFMFIVGVAAAYSFAARRARGDSPARLWGHVVYRAVALTLLGVFLRSNRHAMTNWTFEDVVSQVGLGYCALGLVSGKRLRTQALVAGGILFAYWLLFALWPAPGEGYDFAGRGVPEGWNQFTGFAAHWNKYVNPAGEFDHWLLGLFPREKPWTYNGGGYATLSFIPSMGTMIFGLMTGEWLRSDRTLGRKIAALVACGLAALAFGMAVDGNIWPGTGWTWSVAPIVKRIWTPSWAVFSAGWALLLLAAFLTVIDGMRLRRWAAPLLVVGMNSLAVYIMHYTLQGWIADTLRTHLGREFFKAGYWPIVLSLITTGGLWTAAWWMNKKRIYVRV